MQNSEDKIILELNLKFQMKEYRIKFLTKKGVIVIGLMMLIKLCFWYFGFKT